MFGPPEDDADFYRSEIERDKLSLTQAIDSRERSQLQRRIAAAEQHLAELEPKP